MQTTVDPIADLLTRIRNSLTARHSQVVIPGSKIKLAIAQILEKYGYVKGVEWSDEGPQGQIVVQLGYDRDDVPLIRNLRRVSKPSRRVYVGVDDVPEVLNGLGLAIMSTSKGVITGAEARAANIGGEVLCTVY